MAPATPVKKQSQKTSKVNSAEKSKQSKQSKHDLKPDTVYVACCDSLQAHGTVAECELASGGNELLYVKAKGSRVRSGCVYDVKIEWADVDIEEHDAFDPVGTIWHAKEVSPQRRRSLVKKLELADRLGGCGKDGEHDA
eukprot:TRINITY_DN52318_c0_g1_i1.p1 TRINITY_DN52318_c0_g1~~TRINITY_DN52318_c0_g1_i1.p1  ORF type:complete len:139 (-),score=18.80 TRINITY_DN52318_c0_g1_i1:109-525(-)